MTKPEILHHFTKLGPDDSLGENDMFLFFEPDNTESQLRFTVSVGNLASKAGPWDYYRLKTPLPEGHRLLLGHETVQPGDKVWHEGDKEWLSLVHFGGLVGDTYLQARPEGVTADPAVTTTTTGNPKDRIGDTKPDLSLVPPALLIHAALAMGDGAKKYGPYNWRDNKVRCRVYLAAAMRHISQFLDGEDIDPKSLVNHLGHAAACCGIVLDAQALDCLIDDRPKPGPASKLISDNIKTK